MPFYAAKAFQASETASYNLVSEMVEGRALGHRILKRSPCFRPGPETQGNSREGILSATNFAADWNFCDFPYGNRRLQGRFFREQPATYWTLAGFSSTATKMQTVLLAAQAAPSLWQLKSTQ
jgi:hypothetical protein